MIIVRRRRAILIDVECAMLIRGQDFDLFFVGFGMLGFGGPALHLGIIHLSNLYPGNKVRSLHLEVEDDLLTSVCSRRC